MPGVRVPAEAAARVRALIRELAGRAEGARGQPAYFRLVAALGEGLPPAARELVLREMRPALARSFAYAVPSAAALDRIAEAGRVVEVGAGGGYWAACLAARGADVQAFDQQRPADTADGPGRQLRHHEVKIGGPTRALAAAPGARALLLCWPPGMLYHRESGAAAGYSRMGEEALEAFRGDTVAFVGERSSSFGSPAFFRRLRAEFRLEDTVAIPNLGDWRDAVHIYRRR
jgi:hypothetical protein